MKVQSIFVFLDIAKFADFWRKVLISAELEGYFTLFIFFFLGLP